MNEPRPELTRTTLAVLFIGGLIFSSFWIIRPFLAPLIWATMIVVATWPLMCRVQHRCWNSRFLAVTFMMLALLLVFVVPLTLAIATIATLAPGIAALPFMGVGRFDIAGTEALVSRSGYTGEDGVEISVPGDAAEAFAQALLALPGVAPVGLGARDSLRLEAGLCLYGNDIDETTSPVEANLTWTIGKRRRTEWNFRGAARIRAELDNGPQRLRVGIRPEGRQPARGHTPIHAPGGDVIGEVTSGGFGPSASGPVAMGYVARSHAADGTPVELMVRGKPLAARIAPLPFIPHRYAR